MIHFCGSLTYTQETNLYSSWHGEVKALRPLRPKEINFVFSTPNKFRPYHALCPCEFLHQLLKQTKLFFLLFQLKSTPTVSAG